MNITKEEASSFLKDLNISGAEEHIVKRGLPFLNSIILGLQMTCPFQNVTLMALHPEKRHRPTMAEIKDDMFSKRAGLCYTQNVFLYFLLQAIGYEVYFVRATVTSTVTYPDNHIIVLVKNVVVDGDLYLADIACGYPTFTAVSMDFTKESPLFYESFLEYKFIKHDGKILRMHGKGGMKPKKPLPFDLYIDGFRRFYSFDMHLFSDIHEVDEVFENVYTLPEVSSFHLSVRVIAFPNKNAIAFVNNSKKTENDSHELDSVTFENDEDLLKCCLTYFPQLGETTIRNALANWHSVK